MADAGGPAEPPPAPAAARAGGRSPRRSSLKEKTKDRLATTLLRLFAEADHDQGGTVSKLEMMCLLRENRDKLCKVVPALRRLDFNSDVCSDALFERFDVDGDGELDKAEFVDGFVFEARSSPPHGAHHTNTREHGGAPIRTEMHNAALCRANIIAGPADRGLQLC